MQINVPKIREMWYTKSELNSDLEKFIMVMVEPDEEVALEIAKGSEIMTDLAYEAIMASEEGRVIGSYDRELAWKEMLLKEGQAIGEKCGEKRGLELGRKSQKMEIVNKLLAEKMSIDFISRVTGLSKKEINKIKE